MADKVVAIGDPLFGSTVTQLGFFRGLNNRNDIVFNYTLADGREGIARARLLSSTTPTRVVSRKSHGNAGAFDLPLPLTGPSAVESRSGGASGSYQIVFTFPAAVTFSGASVAPGAGGSAMLAGTPTSSADGTEITIDLTGVTNAQKIAVTLAGVNGVTDLIVPLRILVGDTNHDGMVNSGDALLVRTNSGAVLSQGTFASDLNADGSINSGDAFLARKNSGTAVAP